MWSSSSRQQWAFITLFIILLCITRSTHFGNLTHLPDASWAVFFLAGVYLTRAWALPLLCALAVAIDYVAIHWGGVSAFCVTPAYVMLLPAYASLWLSGRLYRFLHRNRWSSILILLGASSLGAVAAELFSGGGFYILSGYFLNPSWAEFGAQFIRYFPYYWMIMLMYVGLAALLHGLFLGFSTVPNGILENPDYLVTV